MRKIYEIEHLNKIIVLGVGIVELLMLTYRQRSLQLLEDFSLGLLQVILILKLMMDHIHF